jgi:hypothetical protein
VYKPMHVITDEEFDAQERRADEWAKQHWSEQIQQGRIESDKRRDQSRQEMKKEFPFTAIVKGGYPELDNAHRWCWNNISPRHGKCEYEHLSEYPGCPLVKMTEYIENGTYKDKEGKEHFWEDKKYKEVELHEHEGVWNYVWLGKTGYDYGDGEFYFNNEADRDAFVTAVPTIGLGERYEKEKKEQ